MALRQRGALAETLSLRTTHAPEEPAPGLGQRATIDKSLEANPGIWAGFCTSPLQMEVPRDARRRDWSKSGKKQPRPGRADALARCLAVPALRDVSRCQLCAMVSSALPRRIKRNQRGWAGSAPDVMAPMGLLPRKTR